jgi:pyrroline-5-carboxylate reductase
MDKKIGIIGFGNMGSAIGERLKSDYQVFVFDKDKNKAGNLKGMNVVDNTADLIKQVDVVILAVKPQDFDELLKEIKDYVKDKLIISIAAGISTKYIGKQLGGARVIRAMPNLPAKIGRGMICLCRGKSATEDDLAFVLQLFKNLGQVLVIRENMMSFVTAVSGSGPGYFYDFIENQDIDYYNIPDNISKGFEDSLAEAARALAFDAQQAMILANTTTAGSIALLKETGLSPAELKKQVVSKGGTTEAGLNVLHKGGSLAEAVKAAAEKAKELSKEEQL